MDYEQETDMEAVMQQTQAAWDGLLTVKEEADRALAEAQEAVANANASLQQNGPAYQKVKSVYEQWKLMKATPHDPAPAPATQTAADVEARLRNLENSVAAILKAVTQNKPRADEPPPAGSPVPRPQVPPTMPSAAEFPSRV